MAAFRAGAFGAGAAGVCFFAMTFGRVAEGVNGCQGNDKFQLGRNVLQLASYLAGLPTWARHLIFHMTRQEATVTISKF